MITYIEAGYGDVYVTSDTGRYLPQKITRTGKVGGHRMSIAFIQKLLTNPDRSLATPTKAQRQVAFQLLEG